jgi:hypothetical protein
MARRGRRKRLNASRRAARDLALPTPEIAVAPYFPVFPHLYKVEKYFRAGAPDGRKEAPS